MGRAHCKSCGAELLWASTEQGKAIPLDAEPSEKGNVELRREHGTYGKTTAVVHAGPVPGGRLAHFVTCPNAKEFRKAQKRGKR